MRKPTLRTALKLSNNNRNLFTQVRRQVASNLGVKVGFGTPVILDTFDGKVASYRLQGKDDSIGQRKMNITL